MVVGSRYEAYKDATAHVINWIHKCADQVLDTLKTSRPEAFAHHSDLQQDLRKHIDTSSKPPIRMIDNMLNVLYNSRDDQGAPIFGPHTCPSFFDSLPDALSNCIKAIDLRTTSYRMYRRATDTSNPHVQKSNEKHRYFIEVMKVWHQKLRRLWKKAKRAMRMGSGNLTLHESFAALAVNDGPDRSDDDGDGDADSDEEGGDHETRPHSTCTDVTIYGFEMEEEHLDDFDDIAFVMQCLMQDMDDIMKTVASAWAEVRAGTSNFVCASLVSVLAFRRVKELTKALESEFPEIKSFEDFASALSQPVDDKTLSRALTKSETMKTAEKLQNYAITREYPDGSLQTVMGLVASYLRSFTSAIPAKRVKLLLRPGIFGRPYDEMEASVQNILDFCRFLLEHLPLVFNEHLIRGDFFEDYNPADQSPRFLLFKEMFEEFKKYFAAGRNVDNQVTSIPLVFLTSIWYHSVQILQGGMLLSRITATTRKALRTFGETIGACFAQHHSSHNGIYFGMAADKVKYLEKHSSFYRNHPLMAGIIALDVAVNLSVTGGIVEMATSLSIHRVLHLYNAMVCGGGLKKSPVIENFFSVHPRAFFLPVRPSRNFLRAIERNPPGIEEGFSEVYRILYGDEKPPSGSFAAQASHICAVWTREYVAESSLGFNYIEYSRALKAIGDNIAALAPVRETWDTKLLFFVGFYDNDMAELGIVKRAVACMAKNLETLSVTAVRFDLMPRVSSSMQAALYGPLVANLGDEPSSPEEHAIFSGIMDVFEDGSGPLTTEEFVRVFTTCRDHPNILGMHSPLDGGSHMLLTGIVNHVAVGPRCNTELLECLLQLDGMRVKGPVDAMHACAAKGKVEHLEMVLAVRNYSEVDRTCMSKGNTALHYAVQFGRKKVIEYLGGLMADCNIENAAGKTALDLARSNEIRAAVIDLSNYRADESFRVQSRPDAVARENERRWSEEAKERRERVQQRLKQRREEKKPAQAITADQEARAEKAAAELLAMEEEEKKKGKKGKGKKGGAKGKGKKR